jgi:SpoVK/Ycf46/Vps4 family AAA+-type ATPase
LSNPPKSEILRKGRFDEMFFLNLPTREEREAIFEVHLEKYRPDLIQNFQIPLLGQLSKEFSGAEIEAVVIEAMRLGFNDNREFNNEDILVSIQNLVPLARTKSKEINLLKEWAESGNVISASKYK